MTDIATGLGTLRRPKLLLAAARHGLSHYRRDRDLARILRARRLPDSGRAVAALIDAEAQLEEARKAGGDGYNLNRHVDLLIALLAEARLLIGRGPQPV